MRAFLRAAFGFLKSFGASGSGSRAPGISSVRLAEAGDKDRTSQGLGFRGDKELTSSYHNDSLGLRAYKGLTSSHQTEETKPCGLMTIFTRIPN